MFCKNCGQEIDDKAVMCPHCGAATDVAATAAPAANPNAKKRSTGVALAAKVFIIIGMVFGCWMILPLIFGGIALSQMGKGKPSVGIGVCVLLFCNLIGGILLLCSDESNYVY
ncbi:MAG: zinc ribbon domain-containing protein [Clostridia bacterium]|nr:zinc ribbon domain-containing protein [Clostridia bacterium]